MNDMVNYQKPRSTRRELRTLGGRFRGGKLAPVMATAFRESESGVLDQSIVLELDPIAGRVITPITAELIAVYVPIPACDALKNPEDDYPGNAEAFRHKLLSGNPVFGLEEENEITKRLGVSPRPVSGVKYANEVVRLAHICAVNYLRQSKYVKAQLLDSTAMSVTPAIIGQTVLDRLNGVLDPEDRVNGAFNVNFPSMQLPVRGIGVWGSANRFTSGQSFKETGGQTTYVTGQIGDRTTDPGLETNNFVFREDPDNPGYPGIFAHFDPLDAGSLSLNDFYVAEKTDAITRALRQKVDDNPLYGEEIVARYAHGLSVELGRQPFTLYRKEVTFGTALDRAMDGANLGKLQTNHVVEMEFAVPVPRTEFGGIVITFAVVKPDETLGSQPHPILSAEWGKRNYVADELAIDPVPVTVRELNSDCDQADEETVALYVGNNHLQKMYVNYGFNRHLDPTTVENKTALWQLEVPMSVTPESVLYPEDLDHYPFADQEAEICTYTINSYARVDTPLIFGPTPVEELAAIETEDVFEDAE